jgi:hypothetical protein
LNTPDLVHFGVDAGVTLFGYYTNHEMAFWA